GQDGDFDLAAMVERYNADLGKNLGNLLARTLGLCTRMSAAKVPPPGEQTALEKELFVAIEAHRLEVLSAWDRIEPHRALERIWAISSLANQYVDRAAPWAEDKKGNRARVDTILNTLVSVLGALSQLVWPVLPNKSEEMRKQLGLGPLVPALGTDWLAPGVESRKAGEALAPGTSLFPTLDESAGRALIDALTPRIEEIASTSTSTTTTTTTTTTTNETASTVTYDQFSQVDLRVGVVRTCERVPKKDKLLKLAVDVGEAEPRTIVAGLALSFQPEALVGRRVVVVANLAPREFGRGLVSYGMLLATGPSEELELATVDGDVAPGARLK
ncbi:MAG TPA: methionine--tRNA ligase subunit beta, partial [Polyangiaceae bacterium]|nr:methionine--tRNA ligase subunit beta [Polyangiaceae bacterium]